MKDLIDRQAAIDAVRSIKAITGTSDDKILLIDKAEVQTELMMLPTAEPHNFDEWCDDCKEYDHENHCCPRFNRVIRTAMEEAKGEEKDG